MLETSSSKASLWPRFDFWSHMSCLAVGIFLLLLIYPLGWMLGISFMASGPSDTHILGVYLDLFSKPYYYQALTNSIILSLVATCGALALGVPLAYIVSRFNIPGKLAIRAAIVLSFVAPPFIGAYSWILLLGNNGILRRALADVGAQFPTIYGWGGLILVLSLQGMPFVFLLTGAALKTVDQSVEDAAINLGRRPFAVFRTAILPLLLPGISTAALLVFVTAFSDFGTPAIIGQNLRVFPRLIYSEFINETTGGNYTLASALSVVLLLASVGALIVQRLYAARHSYGAITVSPLRPRILPLGKRIIAALYAYAVILLASLPLLTVIVTSFLRTKRSVITGEFTLDGYLRAPRLWSSLVNTLTYTTLATVICVAVGCIIGYIISRRKTRLGAMLDFASMMPYAVAGVVFGIAYSATFGGPPFFLAGTALILVLVYVIRRLPYSIRSVSSMLAQMGTDAEEASINLGVPPGKTFWRITIPMIQPAILSGALLTWATVIREFNATVILYGTNTMTMSVEVFRQVVAGNFGDASVVGTVLIAISLIPIVILFSLLGKDEEFLV
ncbi:MAG: iron ABC transporter permease [Shinella sp.]|nr:iron ABC transporter permease [Shinella sp.]